MAYTRRLRPKGVLFSGLRYRLYMKGKGLVEVYKRARKSVFLSTVKRPSRANTSIYGCEKVEKYPYFMIL